jgi:hypothetical protein
MSYHLNDTAIPYYLRNPQCARSTDRTLMWDCCMFKPVCQAVCVKVIMRARAKVSVAFSS